VAEHWPQAPFGWQAGVAGPHCASAVQARQVCVPASHTGVMPPQSALVRQATQIVRLTWHSGVVPMQAVALDAEH
jgi:hypothetical protein